MAKAPFIETILAFITNLVPKRVKRAIDILLHPCCDIEITDIDFTCEDTDVVDVVITLSGGINFPVDGSVLVNVTIGDNIGTYETEYTGGNTISINDAPLGAGEVDVEVVFLFPTNFGESQGVYVKTPSFTITVPSC